MSLPVVSSRGNYVTTIAIPSSPALTASGSVVLSEVDYGRATSLVVEINAKTVSGTTPSATFVVEDSIDGEKTWNVVESFTAITTAGTAVKRITSAFGNKLRLSYTISGTTPSFVVEATVVAHGSAV
jgi:hypothetical protein